MKRERLARAAGPLLALATAAVFWPIVRLGFLELDDNTLITANPFVRQGLSWPNVRWAFTTYYDALWHPLTWLSHMLDCQLYGLNPWGHHLTALLLHAASAWLLYAFLHKTTRRPWESAVAAALFALHPLRVESVAWAAERKDQLCVFFFLGALLAYARYAERPSAGRYLAALALGACALMSKAMAVTLPLLLVLLDYWPLARRPLAKERLAEKIPFALLSAGLCLVTMRAQRAYIAADFPWRWRLAAAPVFCFQYVGKILWPTDLALFYAHPLGALPRAEAAAAAAGLVAITVLAWRQRRRRPHLLFGWSWFLIALLPVIGLVQITGRSIANRFTYIPQIGLCAAFAWSLAEAPRRKLATAAAAALALACAVAARHEVSIWADPVRLYRRTLAVAPDNELFHNILGVRLASRGELAGAQAEFERAIALRPDYADAHNDLGFLYVQEGRVDMARKEFSLALKLSPGHPQAAANLARLDRRP